MSAITLGKNARVAVIGAGPAGSLFSHYLLHLAEKKDLRLDVVMYDRKDFRLLGPRGCNMCAGVVGSNLMARFGEMGINLEGIVQRRIAGYTFKTRWDSVYLRKAQGNEICTFYRGSGPRASQGCDVKSLDQYLLSWALDAGATLRSERATGISRCRLGKLAVETEVSREEFDFVAVASGINSTMPERVRGLGIGYVPPKIWNAAQMEIALGTEYITRVFKDQIIVMVPGMHSIKFLTIIPKKEHITVCALGRKITRDDMMNVLRHDSVRTFLPEEFNVSCMCFPRMAVSSPQKPYGDRIVVIGDASFSRYMKNGIESAFLTATLAAGCAVNAGIDEESFRRHYYERCLQIFERDNMYGKFLFLLNDLLSRVDFIARAHVNLAKQEEMLGEKHLSSILWNIFTGDERYARVFRDCLDGNLHRELLREIGAALFGRRGSS